MSLLPFRLLLINIFMPRLRGHHTGSNLAKVLHASLVKFNIQNRVSNILFQLRHLDLSKLGFNSSCRQCY